MIAQDCAFDKSMKMFEGILSGMERGAAKGQRLSDVEERLHGELHELGRFLLQLMQPARAELLVMSQQTMRDHSGDQY